MDLWNIMSCPPGPGEPLSGFEPLLQRDFGTFRLSQPLLMRRKIDIVLKNIIK